MLDELIEHLKQDAAEWEIARNCFQERAIAPGTTLLREGEVSNYLHFIRKGCLRMWFNNDGKDITLQFFFENQAVSSIESFLGRQPSLFNLESIEASVIVSIRKEDFDALLQRHPEMKNGLFEMLLQRMGTYANLFLSRIKDKPRQRYEDLLKNYPEIVQRVPQHYIASYLGITPVSLSRIRNKK